MASGHPYVLGSKAPILIGSRGLPRDFLLILLVVIFVARGSIFFVANRSGQKDAVYIYRAYFSHTYCANEPVESMLYSMKTFTFF